MLLEEITRGSFCGLIAIPPASTWSRARNSRVPGPLPLRSRDSPLGIQGLSPKFLDQVKEHNQALEFCVMALDQWCQSLPLRPFFFVAPEDRGGQIHTGPASIWQLAEIMPNVLVKQFEAAHSRASCEPMILHVRSPSSQISVNSGPVSFKAGQGYGRKETSCNTLALSLTVVLVVSTSETTWSWTRKKVCDRGVSTVRSGFLDKGVGHSKQDPWGWSEIPGGESVQDSRGEEQTELEYSLSLWFSSLSISPDSQMDTYKKFIHSSLPAPGGIASHLSASSIPSLEGSSSMCPLSVVGPAKGELDVNGWELGTVSGAGAGRTVSSSVGRGGGVLVAGSEDGRGVGRSSDSGIGGGTAAVADRTPKNRDHEVHAVSESRGINLSTRLSRFDESGWISFSSQSTHISSIDQGSKNPLRVAFVDVSVFYFVISRQTVSTEVFRDSGSNEYLWTRTIR